MNLLPTPRSISAADGFISIDALNLPAQCPFLPDVMRELWAEHGGHSGGSLPLSFVPVEGLAAEEYLLDTGAGGATIRFSAPRGAYYGFVTLCALARSGEGRIPHGALGDAPALAVRAVTDDVSRGQLSHAEHFKSIVKRLSLLKLNLYMPYLEDVFRFQSEPEIGRLSDAAPASEWRALAEYARRYFVDVRPIFNTLGHWDRIGCLEPYRELMLVSEPSSSHAYQTLDPRHPRVRPLLARLLGELVDAFGPGALHVGGDEPLQLREVFGREQAAALFNAHYRWLYDEVRRLGCEMLMYSDVYTPYWGGYGVGLEAARALPRDIQLVFWWYDPDADYAPLSALMDLGFRTYISPSTSNCRVLMPETRQAYRNTQVMMDTARGRSAGLMMSGWGDGSDCPRELNWPAYAIAAEFGWASRPAAHDALMQTFYRQFCALDAAFDYERIADLSAYQLFGMPGWANYRRAWSEFWRDPRDPPDAAMQQRAPHVLERVLAMQVYLDTLAPRANGEFIACVQFAARRIEWLARKLLTLETGRYRTREQARDAVPAVHALSEQLRGLHETARQRWFASNRQAQWGYVDARYRDLADAHESLARYSAHAVHFQSARKVLLEQMNS